MSKSSAEDRRIVAAGLRGWKYGSLASASLCLAGCGANVPDMAAPGGEPHATAFLVNKIVDHVKSELGCAVVKVIDYDKDNAASKTKRALAWLDSWSGKMSLKLIVDEKTTITPGVSLTHLYSNAVNIVGKSTITTPQSFVFGFGGQFSSDATRTDQSDYSFNIKKDFLDNPKYAKGSPTCSSYTGFLTDGDLKLYDVLDSRTFPYEIPGNVDDTPPSTLQTEISFIVAGSGNITPTWKFVAVSGNTANPLLNSGRISTDDILITFGPSTPNGKPSQALETAHDIGKQTSGFSAAVNSHQ